MSLKHAREPEAAASAVHLGRRLAGEAIATALLLAAVVGSGIMAERLADGNVGLALLANSTATGAALVALILAFGPISGAHLNPVVTAVAASRHELSWRHAVIVIAGQLAAACFGVMLAHFMFEEAIVSTAAHVRSGGGQLVSETVATFGLVAVILGTARTGTATVAAAVGAYIMAAYWFTASTSFANPAVTVARAATDTFTGIRPLDVPGFVAAQVVGGLAAASLFRWLMPVSQSSIAPERESTRRSA